MYDLPNNNVRVSGSVRIINFNILSETMESGRRTLTMRGTDYMDNEYLAEGHFDKQTFILKVTRLETVASEEEEEVGQIFVSEDGITFISEDEQNTFKPE